MNNKRRSLPYIRRNVDSYEDLIEYFQSLKGNWIYRGQDSIHDLETTLERECIKSCFEGYAPAIEDNMIREFRRIYDGDDRRKVQTDTLYCLSLMRHFGAPTRLLDFTYSVYVAAYFAAYFALECAYNNVPKNQKTGAPDYKRDRTCSVWSICTDGLQQRVEAKYEPKVGELLKKRGEDSTRKDCTFIPLYMHNKYKIVVWENPIQLHKRLHVQQGIHLCPGSVKTSFMKNLSFLFEDEPEKVQKVTWSLTPSDLQEAFSEFKRMNITRESLLPGLEGFAQSMKYQIPFYKKLDELRHPNINST